MHGNHSGCCVKTKDKDGSKGKGEKDIVVFQERWGLEVLGSSGCN